MNYSTMTQNRKRSRNILDDDASDFMPLSKRINNLHINNAAFQAISHSNPVPTNMFLKPTEWGPGPPICYNSENQEIIYRAPETPESIQTPQYNPELDETQNPYYYNNKLLFDLYVERMQRNGQSFQ